MKKIFFTVFIFLLQYNMYGQKPCATETVIIKTPNGSDVRATLCGGWPDDYIAGMDAYTRSYAIEVYEDGTDDYNCHGYAWSIAQGGSRVWINNYLDNNLDPYWEDGSYTVYPYSTETHIAGLIVFYDPNIDQDHSAITISVPDYLISKMWYGVLALHRMDNQPYNPAGATYYIRSNVMMIAGQNSVCYDGNTFHLVNPPAGTITWTLQSNGTLSFSQTSSNTSATGNPVTVYRRGSNSGTGTLRAFVNGIEVLSKTITTCVSPRIEGPDVICGSSSATYSLTGLPSNVADNDIVWESSSNLTLQGGTTGKSKTVTKTGDGFGWVRATIGAPYHLQWTKGDIVLGVYQNPTVYYDMQYVSCGAPVYMEPFAPSATSYQWDVLSSGSYSFTNSGLTASAYFYDSGYTYTVKTWAYNDCGLSPTVTHEYVFSVSGDCYSSSSSFAYPNPVRDILYIDLDAFAELNPLKQSSTSSTLISPDPSYDVRLYNVHGNLLRQQKARGGTVEINVSGLLNGIYYLHVYDGVSAQPEVKQIVVQ